MKELKYVISEDAKEEGRIYNKHFTSLKNVCGLFQIPNRSINQLFNWI